MPRNTPFVISARVNSKTLGAIQAAAARQHTTLSNIVCLAVAAVAGDPSADPAGLLKRVATALGMPDATPAEILATIQDAMESLDPSAADPTVAPADPLAPAPEAPPAKLAAVTPPGRPHGAGDPRPLSPVHQQMAKAAGVSPYEMQRLLAANPVPRSPAKVPGRPTPKKA